MLVSLDPLDPRTLDSFFYKAERRTPNGEGQESGARIQEDGIAFGSVQHFKKKQYSNHLTAISLNSCSRLERSDFIFILTPGFSYETSNSTYGLWSS